MSAEIQACSYIHHLYNAEYAKTSFGSNLQDTNGKLLKMDRDNCPVAYPRCTKNVQKHMMQYARQMMQ